MAKVIAIDGGDGVLQITGQMEASGSLRFGEPETDNVGYRIE